MTKQVKRLEVGQRVKNTGWPFIAGNGGYGDLGFVAEAHGDRVRILWDCGLHSTEFSTDVALVSAKP